MCGFYGHGWWDPERHRMLRDYLAFNSHREIPGHCNGRLRYLISRSTRQTTATWVANMPILTDPQFETKEKIVELVPYGVDPANGGVIIQGNCGHSSMDISRETKLLIHLDWWAQFDHPRKLEPWIEHHFGRLGDTDEWVQRGPSIVHPHVLARRSVSIQDLCLDEIRCRELSSTHGEVFGLDTAGKLIDAFRAMPNETWLRAPQYGATARALLESCQA